MKRAITRLLTIGWLRHHGHKAYGKKRHHR
jgi:hypothetical protein